MLEVVSDELSTPGNSDSHVTSMISVLDGWDRDGIDRGHWQAETLKAYGASSAPLCRYLRSLGLTLDEAEDVIQETFLRLAKMLSVGNKISNIRAWVFQVAHNLSMDIHREHRRSRSGGDADGDRDEGLADSTTNPEWIYLQKEKDVQIKAAMGRLTPRQLRSVLLRSEGLRYRQIALLLGVSEQRAIYLVKRALERILEL